MCLAIPGQILELIPGPPLLALVDVTGVRRKVDLGLLVDENPEPGDRTLRFRIDALLRADPSPEPVIFDSTLEPATHQFAVAGG